MAEARTTQERQKSASRVLRALTERAQKTVFIVAGLGSLIWFLVRVIPKPSRAAHPCQRAALPLAAAFTVWATGLASSALFLVKARIKWRGARYGLAAGCFMVAVAILVLASSTQSPSVTATIYKLGYSLAGTTLPSLADRVSSDSLTVSPAAVVGAAKSATAHARDIGVAEIASMVNQAIERAGGLEGIVADGDTVVLKPNIIAAEDYTASQQPLNPEANGIATDYRVIQAVVDAVRHINHSGAVYVLEGSGVGVTADNMAILRYDQIRGIDGLISLEEACGSWRDTTSVQLRGVSLPEGKALYPGANRYWFNRLYYEADVLISLPVLKNHFNTGVTGSVKNVGIGATPPTIYGLGPTRPNPHERSAIDHGRSNSSRTNLHNWIHDFYMCRPVDFVVMDGLQGIENGPLCHMFLNGTQAIEEDQMNARLILAGRDPIAVDSCASLLCGQDPRLVQHLVTLHNDSLGCADPRLIRIDGLKVGDEKQSYEIANSGERSRYLDFTAPSFSVDSCYVLDGHLNLALTVDSDVTKVEATVNSDFLEQIRLGEFEQFRFDLGSISIDEQAEVTVYAYDEYLNYQSHTLAIWPSAVELGSFEMTTNDGVVAITWVTSFEDDNLGFNILRSAAASQSYTQLNEQLIRGAGTVASDYRFVDDTARPGKTYAYRLEALDRSGDRQLFELGSITVAGVLPGKLRLHDAQPNPFNPATTITFELPARGDVELTVLDVHGRVIRTLVAATMQPGRHPIEWDGRDDGGRQVASGVYVYRLRTNEQVLSSKMVLAK